jgi:acyl-CoA thioesterase
MTSTVDNPLDYAKEVVGKDPMAQFLGINVEEVTDAYARCSVTIVPQHLNAVERAHGAIIYAVADQAFAVASYSTGVIALSLSFNITYISGAVDGEKIFAEAEAVNLGTKVSVWKVNVYGSQDKLIATGEGIAYHKGHRE